MSVPPADDAPRSGGQARAPAPDSWPQDTRMRILAAMAATVAERGYVDTRVQDVIRQAGGMSTRTFYRHFSDREDCFFAAYDTVRDDALALLTPRPAPESAPADLLREALRRGLEHFASWPDHARVLLIEVVAVGPRGAARHEATMSELAALLVGCEAWEPQPGGTLSAPEQAQALVGAFHRVVTLRLAEGRQATLPEVAASLTALVLSTN